MTNRLQGKEVAEALTRRLAEEVAHLRGQGVCPCLGVLRVGERDDDVAYEKSAVKRCGESGIAVRRFLLPAGVTQEELLETIRGINEDPSIHGLLLLRPLPAHLDEGAAIRLLDPAKDVDGITPASMAALYSGQEEGFAPCTARACMELLEHYDIPLEGKRVVILGRSLVVGKPAAMLALRKNATVTVCHTRTQNLEQRTREADVLIVAVGRPEMVGAGHIRKGQVVLDVGIHLREDGRLCGDVKWGEAEPLAEAITPVPGGVGTVTASVLALQVAEAARRQSGDRGRA